MLPPWTSTGARHAGRRIINAIATAIRFLGLGACLALAIVAARARARPGFRIGVFTEELKGARGRLDALETVDEPTSVRAVFSWSLSSLPAPAARMFALLGTHPGPDITVPAAASLAAMPLHEFGGGKEFAVIIIRHEADFHAFLLVRGL